MDGTVDNQPFMAFAEQQTIDEVVERCAVVGSAAACSRSVRKTESGNPDAASNC
jgi:hypothetical protein